VFPIFPLPNFRLSFSLRRPLGFQLCESSPEFCEFSVVQVSFFLLHHSQISQRHLGVFLHKLFFLTGPPSLQNFSQATELHDPFSVARDDLRISPFRLLQIGAPFQRGPCFVPFFHPHKSQPPFEIPFFFPLFRSLFFLVTFTAFPLLRESLRFLGRVLIFYTSSTGGPGRSRSPRQSFL